MVDLLPTTATARSVALQLDPDTDLLAGSFLRLVTNPAASATARTVESTDPTAAIATARGIGAGYSKYYEGLLDENFYNSINLWIGSGGGQIDGQASASSYASGRGDTAADSLATNIGLANLSYLDRYGGRLLIGSSDTPFSASATAATGSVLGPVVGSTPNSSLNANAIVRGLEGSRSEAAPQPPAQSARIAAGSDSNAAVSEPLLFSSSAPSELSPTLAQPRFDFYGQPNAVVEAKAELVGSNDGLALNGQAIADAKGIDAYTIKAVPFGNGDGTASISGDATARLKLAGSLRSSADPVTLNGQAIGIDGSLIFGAPTLATTVTGRGLALADVGDSEGVGLEILTGIGIHNSYVYTNQGNDVVRGFAGFSGGTIPLAQGASPNVRDAAGIDSSGMYTGLGNDVIFGKILNEVEADTDANGDGLLEDSVFLDHSANDGTIGGFDGIRNSTANTGIGNDYVGGASNGSHFYAEIGNDVIDLDRSKASSLWGGIGNDFIRVKGPSEGNVLWGGLGNDSQQVVEGEDNVLDGGYGQDVSTGGSGVDRFIFSEGGAALQAASSTSLAEDFADQPLWATLSQSQKETLWDTGQLVSGDGGQLLGQLDTVRDFQAGTGGDVLELSSSLAGITQELWETKGAIYGVSNTGSLSVQQASADGSNKVGLVVGSLADIQKMGIGSPSIAFATDTRQLMFDADGNWSQGSISLGTVNVSSGQLNKSNFEFGSTTGNGLGEAPTAQGGVG